MSRSLANHISGRDLLPHLCPILHLQAHSQPHLTTHLAEKRKKRHVVSLPFEISHYTHGEGIQTTTKLGDSEAREAGPRANTQGRLTDLGTHHATASL